MTEMMMLLKKKLLLAQEDSEDDKQTGDFLIEKVIFDKNRKPFFFCLCGNAMEHLFETKDKSRAT